MKTTDRGPRLHRGLVGLVKAPRRLREATVVAPEHPQNACATTASWNVREAFVEPPWLLENLYQVYASSLLSNVLFNREPISRTAAASRVKIVRTKEHQLGPLSAAPPRGNGDDPVPPALVGLQQARFTGSRGGSVGEKEVDCFFVHRNMLLLASFFKSKIGRALMRKSRKLRGKGRRVLTQLVIPQQRDTGNHMIPCVEEDTYGNFPFVAVF